MEEKMMPDAAERPMEPLIGQVNYEELIAEMRI